VILPGLKPETFPAQKPGCSIELSNVILSGLEPETFPAQKPGCSIELTNVILSGLEPETYCLEGSCSIQLSYRTFN
jgi:hypothetical protein